MNRTLRSSLANQLSTPHPPCIRLGQVRSGHSMFLEAAWNQTDRQTDRKLEAGPVRECNYLMQPPVTPRAPGTPTESSHALLSPLAPSRHSRLFTSAVCCLFTQDHRTRSFIQSTLMHGNSSAVRVPAPFPVVIYYYYEFILIHSKRFQYTREQLYLLIHIIPPLTPPHPTTPLTPRHEPPHQQEPRLGQRR